MQTSPLYCSHCGAANDKIALLCFACSSPLSQEVEKLEDAAVLLNQRYRVLTSVGIGGFGTIYKVQDIQQADALFAIKQINLINLSPAQIIEATEAFHREVRMLSSLHHENLPRIYDSFTDPQHWYMVMDFIEGETLEQYLAAKSTATRSSGTPFMPINEIIPIGMQLCAVLAYLHKQQPPIIFRDLKPSNIMRTTQGHLFLIDFGIARQFKPGKAKDTIPLGSPGYAPPEQYGKAQTTPGADIYSFGVLLHQLLSGEDPSEHTFQFAPLRMYGGSDLMELEALIQRMVHKEVEQRPKIDEVKEVFQHLQARDHLPYGNVFALPQPQGTGTWPQSVGASVNPSSPIQQQVPFPQARAVPGKQPPRRRFIMALGAVTLFGTGWFASSEWSHGISPAAKNGADSAPSDTTSGSGSPGANWIFDIGGLTAPPAVADGMVYAAAGWNLYAVDATSGQQKWSFATLNSVISTPLVANGIVYGASQNTNIFAIDAISGLQKWSSSITGDLYMPTIANGIVYISSDDENIYAVDATSGQQKWSFQNSSILTVVNDVVYGSSNNGSLYAIDATSGQKKWSFLIKGSVNTHFTMLTVVNDVAYGSLNNGSLYAIDATSGQKKWSFLSLNSVDASFPVTVANNMVYIGSFEGIIYAIDAETGRKKWAFQTGNEVYSMPVVVNDIVYVGSNDSNIYAIDAETGRKKWAFQTDDAVQAPPTVMNGVVYVGSFDRNIYAIDAETGRKIWAFATAGPVDYTLTIVDAVIYVGSNDNNLYALTTP
jgi:outer membrane protein assembly factor BamB